MPSYKDMNIDYKGGNLDVSSNRISNLAGCPQIISGVFRSEFCYLTTLVGGPQIINGDYLCGGNELTNLVGCASHIGSGLYCWSNSITSLVGIHKIIKSCHAIHFDDNKIRHGGIGLLLIANLKVITHNTMPFAIIQGYVGTGTKGMMECRSELIEKGYSNHAKL